MEFNSLKERSRDRQLVLRPIPGLIPKESSKYGPADKQLFTGANELHCIQDKTSLWYFKYKNGGIPEPLKGRYTTFELAKTVAERYFKNRNIYISDVID